MRRSSVFFIAVFIMLILMFAFTRTLRGEDTSRELRQKNAEINNHNVEKRQYENRPSNTKIDPSYEKYLDSKSDRLEKEHNQIIERGFQEQNRRGK